MKNMKHMQVIMLPANKTIKNGDLVRLPNGNLMIMTNSDVCDYLDSESFATKNQHLYLVSDADIKNDDLKYCYKTNYITQYISKSKGSIADKCECCKKIEATTNSTLTRLVGYNNVEESIPQIPQSFVEAYAKSNGTIKEVQVVMELIDTEKGKQQRNLHQFSSPYEFMIDKECIIKTRPDNTIIIHQNKTYTREDMYKAYLQGEGEISTDYLEEQFNKWLNTI